MLICFPCLCFVALSGTPYDWVNPDDTRPSKHAADPYSALYDLLIPVDDELRLFHDLAPFDFITDLLEDTYCLDNGRMALHHIQILKYLFLKAYSNLSAVDLVRRVKTELVYNYFLNLAP